MRGIRVLFCFSSFPREVEVLLVSVQFFCSGVVRSCCFFLCSIDADVVDDAVVTDLCAPAVALAS